MARGIAAVRHGSSAPPAGGGREKGNRAGAGGPGAREKGKGEKEKSPGGSEDLLCDEEEGLFDQDTLPGAGPKGPPLPEPQTQLGILGDGPVTPAADGFQGAAGNHAERAREEHGMGGFGPTGMAQKVIRQLQ